MQKVINLRLELYSQCLAYANQRIGTAQQALDHAQESANTEEKSSAGDKYETGRAMAHLEREKGLQQLSAALKLKDVLDKIDPTSSSDRVTLGSIVITNSGNFYLAISAGQLKVGDTEFIALSPASPLGALFNHKHVGDQVDFNKRNFLIHKIQ
jgi:transcription elongation GreA/GreB family factor